MQSLALMALLLVLATVAGEFLEQPGPGPILVPVNEQLQLNCSVTSPNEVHWTVETADTSTVSTFFFGGPNLLRSRGFIIEGLSTNRSTLSFTKFTASNNTFVTCVAVHQIEFQTVGRRVQVIFFDVPPAPSDIRIEENGPHSLNISWSLSLTQGNIQFRLAAVNLNASSTSDPIVVSGIEHQHYIFTVEDSTPCVVYSFQVTAMNEAGSSDPSETITRSVPTLPDISPVEESLSHSIVHTAAGLQLNVMFQSSISCFFYPVMSYTLVVEDSRGEIDAQSVPATATDSEVLITVDGLLENSILRYYVFASNDIGDSNETIPVEINVRTVFLCLVDDLTYSVRCTYLNDSDARGCVYTLVSGEEGVENVTGIIERGETDGVTLQPLNISDFTTLLAADLEADNSTSNASITGTTSVLQNCQVLVVDPLSIPTGGLVGIVLAPIIILIMIVLAVTLLIYKLVRAGRRGKGPIFPRQRSSGSYTVNDGQFSTTLPETSARVEITGKSDEVQYAVPSIKKKSPPDTLPPESFKFYYQDPSYESLDHDNSVTTAKRNPLPTSPGKNASTLSISKHSHPPTSPPPGGKNSSVSPFPSNQIHCPAGGDSPLHQSTPITGLEYALVLPRSERKRIAQQKQQQQQQQQNVIGGYMNCDLTTSAIQV